MTDDDVVSGLEGLDALVKDPETGVFAIRVNRMKLMERVDSVERKGYLKISEELLKWTPYLLGRKEAGDMLEGGLHELISQRERQRSSSQGLMVNGIEEEDQIQGRDVPVERFVSVAVGDLVPPPPPISYDRTEPQTPAATDVVAISLPGTRSPSSSTSSSPSPSSSSSDNDDEQDDANISPSSPSAIEDDVSEDEEDEDATPSSSSASDDNTSESSSEFASDSDGQEENFTKPKTNKPPSTNRSRLTRSSSSQTSSVRKATPKTVVSVADKQVGIMKPKVIVAKAPRSRAGLNPPEVMSKRSSLRKT